MVNDKTKVSVTITKKEAKALDVILGTMPPFSGMNSRAKLIGSLIRVHLAKVVEKGDNKLNGGDHIDLLAKLRRDANFTKKDIKVVTEVQYLDIFKDVEGLSEDVETLRNIKAEIEQAKEDLEILDRDTKKSLDAYMLQQERIKEIESKKNERIKQASQMQKTPLERIKENSLDNIVLYKNGDRADSLDIDVSLLSLDTNRLVESIKEIVDEELESYNEDSETQFELQPNEDRMVELLATNVRYDDDETTLFLPVKRLRKQKAKETPNDTPNETPNEVVEETIEEEQKEERYEHEYEFEFRVFSINNNLLYRKGFFLTVEENENDEIFFDDESLDLLENIAKEVSEKVGLYCEKFYGKPLPESFVEDLEVGVKQKISEGQFEPNEKNRREQVLKI